MAQSHNNEPFKVFQAKDAASKKKKKSREEGKTLLCLRKWGKGGWRNKSQSIHGLESFELCVHQRNA